MVTFTGLEDQLLALVVRKEQPDLAALGEKLITQQTGFKIKMRELEDNILYKLATAEGDITEDVELIEGLEESKRVAVRPLISFPTLLFYGWPLAAAASVGFSVSLVLFPLIYEES